MANVYLAVARGPAGFHKLLVLKAIKEDLARDPEVLAMFLDEARLAARLSHPNVVQTLEVDELGGRPAIVMEYLQGPPLAKLLFDPACRDVTRAMKLRVLAAALDGLHYIHELADFDGAPLGLVHRDVSPQNVVVTYDGQVKVLDFGIAKGLVSNASTKTDAIKGKIRYMAPEQMSGEPVDRRADVFSAGVVLWEIATGQRIWQGRSQVNVMNLVINEGVPSPRSVDPSVPPELDAICVKALARDPQDRYATAAALLADLESLLAGMGAPVLLKDVGKLLGDLFAESRAQTQALVSHALKNDRDEGTLEPMAFPSSGAVASDATRTLAPEVLESARAEAPRRSRRAWVALAGAALLGSIVGGVRVFSSPAPLAADAPLRAVDPPVVASARATELTVIASRESASREAVVVPAPPRAVAPRTNDAPPDRPVVRPAVRPSPKRPASAAPVAPSPAVSAPAVDCSPPFYFDAQRIKRLKPECF